MSYVNFSFYNAEKAHPWVMMRRLSHHSSKSGEGLTQWPTQNSITEGLKANQHQTGFLENSTTTNCI